jgi:protein-S-isoprenylcysteine O-methyltransferase Ste14
MTARLSFFFGRALPLGVFGFLVAIQAELAFAGLGRLGQDPSTTVYLVNRLLTLGFFSFLLIMYMVRGRAVARDHNPVAVTAAMVGSFVLFALILVPSPARSENVAVLTASNLCLALGMGQAIYALSYLRQRFSIVPEARGLVTSGPYQLVRHPIYLGEILAGFGLVLPTIAGPPALVFVVFVAAELVRTYYEEGVLRRTYPEYAAYATRTRRLVPFVF